MVLDMRRLCVAGARPGPSHVTRAVEQYTGPGPGSGARNGTLIAWSEPCTAANIEYSGCRYFCDTCALSRL